jgi:hypothetical protein
MFFLQSRISTPTSTGCFKHFSEVLDLVGDSISSQFVLCLFFVCNHLCATGQILFSFILCVRFPKFAVSLSYFFSSSSSSIYHGLSPLTFDPDLINRSIILDSSSISTQGQYHVTRLLTHAAKGIPSHGLNVRSGNFSQFISTFSKKKNSTENGVGLPHDIE